MISPTSFRDAASPRWLKEHFIICESNFEPQASFSASQDRSQSTWAKAGAAQRSRKTLDRLRARSRWISTTARRLFRLVCVLHCADREEREYSDKRDVPAISALLSARNAIRVQPIAESLAFVSACRQRLQIARRRAGPANETPSRTAVEGKSGTAAAHAANPGRSSRILKTPNSTDRYRWRPMPDPRAALNQLTAPMATNFRNIAHTADPSADERERGPDLGCLQDVCQPAHKSGSRPVLPGKAGRNTRLSVFTSKRQ